MDSEDFYSASYTGSKTFTQHEVKTANATGFGAAADDYAERGIDLNEELIRNKPATFFFKMNGDAMIKAGIFDRDILIVDRSLKAVSGKIIVAAVDGELLIRRLKTTINTASLLPENERFRPIELTEFNSENIWGVVTYVIHSV